MLKTFLKSKKYLIFLSGIEDVLIVTIDGNVVTGKVAGIDGITNIVLESNSQQCPLNQDDGVKDDSTVTVEPYSRFIRGDRVYKFCLFQ